MSSIDQNKLLVRQYYNQVVNTGEVDRIPEFVASDYVEISVVNVDRIINGKIVEHGGAANMLESLLNIGAVKVVGSEGGLN
jgi:predicted SnoaL-like aldol condensation-catalyzing enzyme